MALTPSRLFGKARPAQPDRAASLAPPAGRAAILMLLAALLPVLLPHTAHLPPWCSAFAGCMFAWRAVLTWREAGSAPALPPRWLLFLLLALATGATFHTHRTLLGRDPGVTFLTVLLSLKLLETRTRRDAIAAIFLAYFLILTNFFYSQSLATAAVMVVALVLITAALIAANRDAGAMPWRRQVRLATVIIAQALPMMLVLFLLFPRVQGPLWGLPADNQSAVSGLTDSMSPGLITQLSLSDGIAFRVRFDGPVPRTSELYWRGPVLTLFDGRNWRARPSGLARQVRFTAYGPPVDYEVTMEPINQPWLFALEMPNLLPEYARLTNELQPVTEKASPSRQRYRARSSPQFRMLPEENADELAPYLALPPRSNPRTRELMVGWLLEGLTPPQLVERAMTLFRRDNFFYTLEPPLYDNNAVDEFLFDARRGFCEHYASAFVVMMRAARVPARVVTGYQGGDVNSVDGVFTVRQSDAHAWAEVWLAGSGWTRVDPTSAVSPARVERGMASALPQRFAAPFIARFAGSRGAEWLAQARLNWEALSNRWNQLVLNYSPERQRETLEDLGMKAPSWQEMVAAMVLGMGVLALAVGAWLTRRVRERDPVKRAWTRICDRLARQGIARAAHEGPLDFAARAATLPPPRGSPAGRAAALEQAARHYARLRYGPKPDKVAIAEFVALARTF